MVIFKYFKRVFRLLWRIFIQKDALLPPPPLYPRLNSIHIGLHRLSDQIFNNTIKDILHIFRQTFFKCRNKN